jgi:hypothetical protein
MKMNDLVKILLTSGVVSSVVGGGVGWFATSYKIEQELYSKQSEGGYEALINANTLLWQSEALSEKAKQKQDKVLAAEAEKLKRQSDASYHVAQHKIAAFGDERVVKAMGDYYFKHTGAAAPCRESEKVRSDIQIYKAIRNTLGVGGGVSDQHLATLIFHCSLK